MVIVIVIGINFNIPPDTPAQQQLLQQVSDDDVMGHDETLRNNLRSVYLQSETTNASVKVHDNGYVRNSIPHNTHIQHHY